MLLRVREKIDMKIIKVMRKVMNLQLKNLEKFTENKY